MPKRCAIIFLIALLVACKDLPTADKTTTEEKQTAARDEGEPYLIDTAASKVFWLGSKVNGSHKGSICISEGTLGIKNNAIKSGKFTMNIVTLQNSDLPAKDKKKIENHLKSDDFFDVSRFPLAYFAITKVEPFDINKTTSVLEGATHLIGGNLTIKGVTKNVTFPARIAFQKNYLKATANFHINRSDWGMNYKGANNPQNWLISQQVNVKLNIVARK